MPENRKLQVRWRGAFFTNSSLAIVNRRLVQSLIDRGNVDVTIADLPYDRQMLALEFRELATRCSSARAHADITVVHDYPPRFTAPGGSRYVHIQPWEFGSMPQEWYEALHDDCDDIWTHSSYNRAAYVADGLAQERVALIPHGVDNSIFRAHLPSRPAGSTFRFLFVGGTIARKGIDVVFNAYLRGFRPSDDVVLTIKDVNSQTLYNGLTRGEEIRKRIGRTDIPRIEYIDETFTDERMAWLFRSADCLVLPYRGEGFGMPVLEAMACGVPVIVTAGGATDDFVDETVGWRIPSTVCRRDSGELGVAAAALWKAYDTPTVRAPWVLEPDISALVSIMRFVSEHRDEARRRGDAAAERAQKWTWARSAELAEQRFAEIMLRPPVKPKRRAQRYSDSRTYEERVFGETKLEGVLLELFRRIGVYDASFVQLVEGASLDTACVLARGTSWQGLVIGRSAIAKPLLARYAGLSRVKTSIEAFSSATIAERLAQEGIKREFDLLVLECADAAELMEALAEFRPRVIVASAESSQALESLATRLGYAHAVTGSDRGDVLFVRSDLASLAAFKPVQQPAISSI